MMATLYTFHRQSSHLKRHNVARAYVDLRERARDMERANFEISYEGHC